MTEPKVKEVSIHWGGGGGVQLEEYGKQKSDYGCNITRKYEIPPDWDEATVADFEAGVVEIIRGQIEPILQEEHDSRMEVRARIASEPPIHD